MRRSAIPPPRQRTPVVLLILGAALCPLLAADVVHLKAGRVLEGEVLSEGGDLVDVRVGGGTVVRVKLDEILRIDRQPSPTAVFDARFASLEGREIEPLVELLVLAREKRLRKRARSTAARILEIDANHELARWTLGYVVFRNRWVLEKDLRGREDLVRVDGEWMTRDDEERRRGEAARHEVEELLALVESENRRIRAYAVQEIGRRARRRDPVVIEVLGERLADRRLAVRLVAVAELGEVRVAPRDAGGLRAGRVARQLHRLALSEKSPAVRQLLHGTGERQGTIATFYPEESFRLALADSATAGGATESERLAEILVTAVKKASMPDLCRAVAAGGGNAAARLALQRILQVDLGFEAGKWLHLWGQRESEFHDVD